MRVARATPPPRGLLATATLAAALLGGAMVAFAAPGGDPTRPPDAAFAVAAASAPARTRAASEAASAAASAPPVLQSIRLPRDGAASALVDGRLLRVGDTWSGRSVTAIDRDGITLRGPAGAATRLSWATGIAKLASGTALPADDPRARRLAASPPATSPRAPLDTTPGHARVDPPLPRGGGASLPSPEGTLPRPMAAAGSDSR